MAVAKDNVQSTSGVNVGSLSIASFVVAPGLNKVLCFFAGGADGAAAVTYSNWVWNTSETATELTDTAFSTFYSMGAAILKEPTATTATAGVTFSNASTDEVIFAVYAAYNVDQTTPNSTIRTNSAASGSPWIACEGYANGISLGFTFGDGTTSIAATNGIPQYIGTGAVSQSAGAATLTPAAPASLRGDLLVVHFGVKNNATVATASSGWTIVTQDNSGASFTSGWGYRISDGTDVNPVLTWTGSVACGAIVRQYRDGKPDGTPYGTVGVTASTGTTHTSTGFNTTVNDSRVIYLDAGVANTACATPAGWTENADTAGATWVGRHIVGGKEITTAGTGSGNISVTGSAGVWVQRQIELLHADAGDQTEETEQQAIGSVVCGSLGAETGDTYNCFGWTYTGTPANWGALAFGLNPAVTVASSQLLLMPPMLPPRGGQL